MSSGYFKKRFFHFVARLFLPIGLSLMAITAGAAGTPGLPMLPSPVIGADASIVAAGRVSDSSDVAQLYVYVVPDDSNLVARIFVYNVNAQGATTPRGDIVVDRGAYGMAVDSSQVVYVAYNARGTVIKYHGGPVGHLGNPEDPSPFDSPVGVAVDFDDNVYVADRGSKTIRKFDRNGDEQTISLPPLSEPVGVAVDRNGNVFVADRGEFAAIKFDSSGNELWRVGASDPTSIAVDESGNLYVADGGSGAVRVYGSGSQLLKDLPGFNNRGGAIYLATDSLGSQIYISDSGATWVYGGFGATHFEVVAPPTARVGTPFQFTVRALDSGETLVNFSASVSFQGAGAPENTRLALSGGVGTFTAVPGDPGVQYITAYDPDFPETLQGRSGPIDVATALPPAPSLTVTSSHGNFAQGQNGAVYRISVANVGTAATSGVVTVTDTLPASLMASSLQGAGWSCTLAPTVRCVRSDPLPPQTAYPDIVLTVMVANAAPATDTNAVDVSTRWAGDVLSSTWVDHPEIAPVPRSGWNLRSGQTFLADLNGDGAPEIIVVSPDGKTIASLLQQDDNLVPQWFVTDAIMVAGGEATGWTLTAGDRFYVADLNGDGRDEIVVVSRDGTSIGILYQQGGTLVVGSTRSGWVLNPPGAPIPAWPLRSGDRYIVANLDGDRRQELLVVSGDGRSAGVIWAQSGVLVTGWVGRDRIYTAGGAVGWNLNPGDTFLVADLDGDGSQEIVAVNGDRSRIAIIKDLNLAALVVWNGNRNVDYADGRPGWTLGQGETFLVADLDRDGRDELVVTSSDGTSMGVLTGIGLTALSIDRGVVPASPNASAVGWQLNRGDRFLVADLAGDGGKELVAVSADGKRLGVLSVQDGSLVGRPAAANAIFPHVPPFGGGTLPWTLRSGDGYLIADVDGDRREEIVVTSPEGEWGAVLYFYLPNRTLYTGWIGRDWIILP